MMGLETELLDVYLYPGELHFARKPTLIRTILGSCVGVTFWNARSGAGALCHAQLPKCPKHTGASVNLKDSRRYVDSAIRELIENFEDLGAPRAETQVKVFGGGDVLLVGEGDRAKPTVGRLNCEAALETLRAEGFAITASSLGGTSGLKIRFCTATGEVRLRRLSPELIGDVNNDQ
jgi:chemotaxis protein CheD